LGLHGQQINALFLSAFLTFQFCIWESKLRKVIPSFHTMYSNFIELFSQTTIYNSDLRKSVTRNNFSLCRTLLGDRQAVHDGGE
jgi:hypothetical protein